MTHHAYLICGPKEESVARAYMLHSLSLEDGRGNPDVHVLSYGLLSIENAREIKEWAQQKPVHRERRIFIISFDQMLHEAQNALLKLFEEPPKESAFVLIVPHEDLLLATLRSRFEIVNLSPATSETVAARFIALSQSERQKEIAKRTKEKDIGWIRELIASLERHAKETKNYPLARQVLFVETYLNRRGASQKMLLEHLALCL